MHAVIEVASVDDITLIDLGNEPGTLVNGQRVNKCKVRPGDQIQIGNTDDRARASAEPVAVAAAAPPVARSNPFGEAAAPPAAAIGAPGGPCGEPVRRGACGESVRCGPTRSLRRPCADPFAGFANPFAPQRRINRRRTRCRTTRPRARTRTRSIKSAPDIAPEEVEVLRCVRRGEHPLGTQRSTSRTSRRRARSTSARRRARTSSATTSSRAEKLGTTRAPVVLADRSARWRSCSCPARRARWICRASRR
jgi:hypothetical protein